MVPDLPRALLEKIMGGIRRCSNRDLCDHRTVTDHINGTANQIGLLAWTVSYCSRKGPGGFDTQFGEGGGAVIVTIA